MKNQRRLLFWLLPIIILVLIGFGVIGYYYFTAPAGTTRNETRLSKAVSDDFRVADIRLDLTSEQVKRCLGRPLREKTDAAPSFQNPSYVSFRTRWFYSGLEIWFLSSAPKGAPAPQKGSRVIKIAITKPGYKTHRGIGIGDFMPTVKRRYGSAILRNGSLDYYSDWGDLSFSIARFKVSRIEIDANMD